ncbi:MAG TPA: T9SS type A sorting domain-containing protein [Bacteroidia bacterium]|nr:T9SS type A sorting domain-containing protein [Bacteroidia bacterium]HNU32469.1 T9SS type A sorting domain-containing protein [Bacteroidia bacterium]
MKKLLLLLTTLSISLAVEAQLLGISPNVAQLGQQNLQTTITGSNLFFTTSSPAGNFTSGYLQKAGSTIYNQTGSNLYINNNTVSTIFDIPSSTTYLGNYDLYVTATPSTYNLFNSFDVVMPSHYISGYVFYDLNQNGVKDVGESGVPNVIVYSSTLQTAFYTDNTGYYYIVSSAGNHTFNVNAGINYTTSTPSSYTVNVTGAMTTGNDFGLVSSAPNYSGSVQLDGLSFPRCFFQVPYQLKFKNTSPTAYNANAYVVLADSVGFVSSTPAPSSVNGDTVFYNISNLQPYQPYSYVSLTLQMPQTIPQTIVNSAYLQALDGSGNVMNTISYSLIQTVLCSFDPNDKAVSPPGFYAQHYTLFTDTLEYLIRFQNTGNDTAFKVVVRDQLDSDLNRSTFEVLGSSHNMSTMLAPTGLVSFTFDNILLVDSNTNEPASHGWIKYKIRPVSGLAPNTVVTNEALIYFDFNPPVVTNSVFNTLVAVIPVGVNDIENKSDGVKVVPSPAQNEAHLYFENKNQTLYFLNVYSTTGKRIHRDVTQTGHYMIDTEQLTNGLYFYEITDNKGKSFKGKLMVQH